MSYLKISSYLTEVITKDLKYDEEKKEIITYAIETLLLSIVGFTLILILAYLLGALYTAAVAAVFGGLLRRMSGGFHFNTPVKCLTFGAVVYSLLGVISKKISQSGICSDIYLFLLLIISLILVLILAPVDSEAKPIHSIKLRKKLKTSSVIFVVVSIILVFLINNSLFKISVVLGIFYQSLTLLPVFNNK